MENEKIRNIKLGLFVLAGTLLLIIALYLVGSKRELFSSTFRVSARFYNVSGLMPGNNVRFAGIDVGTVKSVEIVDDSSVVVDMVIEKKLKQYIKKNAIASIGTDGLMGNKIVNINSSTGEAAAIGDGDVLKTLRPIETDEAMRTLNFTNDNLAGITADMKKITQKINSSRAMWKLLSDTINTDNFKQIILNLRTASMNTMNITADAKGVMSDVRAGKGTVGSLLTDTMISVQLKSMISGLNSTGQRLDSLANDLNKVVSRANKGNGALNTILSDTAFSNNLNRSIKNIEKGADGFNQNMEALKHNFLFRNYYKKLEKKK
ncbi:MAG: MCE family protein [Bacteroidetes bacterium]|nr:MCE family protein [Bacteroidota bacterium]